MHTQLYPPLTSTSVTLGSAFSAHADTLALFPTPKDSKTTLPKSVQPIYFAQYDHAQLERRELIVETYTFFDSLQKIAREAVGLSGYRPNALPEPPVASQIQYFNRISRLYREAIVKQFALIQADSTLEEEAQALAIDHHANLHGILSLSEILYLPSDGTGDGLVGEEILDWVNTVDRAPSVEEGRELADLARPWEHLNFWPYIYRCILRAHLLSATALLETITTHSSPFLKSLAALPIQLLQTFPRSTAFRSEREYLSKIKDWRLKARRAIAQADELFAEAESDPLLGGPDNEDERFDWEAGFRCLFELIEGNEKKILEASEDWREALGAWGMWVNAGGRRGGLPETLKRITEHHPVDSTLPSESVQASLILGDVPRALQQSNLISIWLVSHLSDLLQKVSVIETDFTSALPLRDYFVLAYTDLLLSDSSLWRIAVEYLSTCGSEGRARMRVVLLGVNLEEEMPSAEKVEKMEIEGSEKEKEVVKAQSSTSKSVVEDVLRICAEQGMDDELKSVCKIYSEQLISQKRYGDAVSYCVRAGDGKRIARIAERVLEEYIVNGQEAFIHHVDSIPTSLLRPTATPFSLNPSDPLPSPTSDISTDPLDSPLTPYTSRLSFLARYRDFFALYAQGERRAAAGLLVLLLTSNVAPKSFHAVMLLDVVPLLEGDELVISLAETYELLRCLEEITCCITPDGEDIYGYLDSLSRIVGGQARTVTKKERQVMATRQLQIVRGALARHLGRCLSGN